MRLRGTLVPKALSGDWRGTLDYRDYSKDTRQTLPTVMHSDGRVLAWIFDDGPTKTVRSKEIWSSDAAGQTLFVSSGTSRPDRWRVAEARVAADGSSLTTVLDGTGKENNRDVSTRKILTRNGSDLRITEQTRAAGEPFLMRQSYELHQ